MYSTENSTPRISSWMKSTLRPVLKLKMLWNICTVYNFPKTFALIEYSSEHFQKSRPPVSMLNKHGWLRHCIFMEGFVAAEVLVKPHFHNKGLSLTALSVVPFWNHLAFRLSFQLNLFCQRRGALIAGPCAIYGDCWCIKWKHNKHKREDQTRQLAELRTNVYSRATVSVSAVSQWRLGWLAELTMLWIRNESVLPTLTLYNDRKRCSSSPVHTKPQTGCLLIM